MNIQEVINNRWAQLAAVGVVGTGAGATAGYFLGRRKVENEVQDLLIAVQELVDTVGDSEVTEVVLSEYPKPDLELMLAEEEEIESLHQEDSDVGDTVDSVKQEDAIETDEVVEDPSGETLNPIEAALAEVEADPTRLSLVEDSDAEEDDTDLAIAAARGAHPAGTSNVFDNPAGGEWDYDVELPNRSADAPYVLHQDEFYADERGYTQLTVTYFEGDQVLVDEQEKPIYNWGQILGELKFGHGSNDSNVVYIRNEKNEAEYEVLLFSGSYEEEVLGISQEPEDVTHTVGKFRASD